MGYLLYTAQTVLHQWLRGPMARRLTTNQEIPGSTPGVIIFARLLQSSGGCFQGEFFFVAHKKHRRRCRLFFPAEILPVHRAYPHRIHGHRAYSWAINRSRYLFSCM
jgi:hypothetical protein